MIDGPLEARDESPDPMATLSRALEPKAGEGLLLLGLHLEDINGYAPMFSSEGKPRTDVRPGYLTVLIRTHDGTARVAGSLPYLAVPQDDGFLFMGEASARIHQKTGGPDCEVQACGPGELGQRPHDYDATEIWTTRDQGETGKVQTRLEAKLRARRQWGIEHTEQLVYVTPRAQCRDRTESEWTGGALWFHAEETRRLTATSGPAIDDRLVSWADDKAVRLVGNAAYETRKQGSGEGDELNLDEEADLGWGHVVSFRRDVRACLDRAEGKVMVTGDLLVPGNSARSFTVSVNVKEAPAPLAPSNRITVPFAAVRAAVPAATDAFVSPAKDTVLAMAPEGLEVVDALHGKRGAGLPVKGRPVMVEWAAGAAAERWERALVR